MWCVSKIALAGVHGCVTPSFDHGNLIAFAYAFSSTRISTQGLLINLLISLRSYRLQPDHTGWCGVQLSPPSDRDSVVEAVTRPVSSSITRSSISRYPFDPLLSTSDIDPPL
jgi:hypothetical protein